MHVVLKSRWDVGFKVAQKSLWTGPYMITSDWSCILYIWKNCLFIHLFSHGKHYLHSIWQKSEEHFRERFSLFYYFWSTNILTYNSVISRGQVQFGAGQKCRVWQWFSLVVVLLQNEYVASTFPYCTVTVEAPNSRQKIFGQSLCHRNITLWMFLALISASINAEYEVSGVMTPL